ncbi:MAG: UDP-N-acetylmuramate dehydrogenase [Phototrophicaceae bacterium]
MTALAQLNLDNLQQNVPLAKYTAARLGGKADWFYMAKNSIQELAEVVQTAWEDELPVRILGGGANVLVSDKGLRGLVVVNRVTDIEFADWHDGRTVSASSGTGLLRLARECANHGIAGMEWAVGVPGTVGGAVVNNAGAHGDDMSNSVADVVVLEQSGAKMLSHAEMHYDYRESILKTRQDRHFVVLQVNFILPYDEPDAIQARMEKFNAYRKETQPNGATLGSIFKNPDGDYAGRLIQASDLKGYRVGGVEVSSKHANFIVNHGDATASDYYALIRTVQEKVLTQQGVELELEIELVGDW